MADNISVTSGTGVTIATDDDGSAQHQWVKIEIGANGSFVPVTTANGLPVQILSLPDLGLNSAVKITSLPDLGLNSVVKITSLPDLGLNSSVKITSLPALTAASATVTNLGTFAVQTTGIVSIASNTNLLNTLSTITGLATINGIVSISSNTNLLSTLTTVTNAGIFLVQVTSLPNFAVGSSVTISNLASVPLTFSGTTIAITSLPDLGLNSVVKITSLPDLGLNSSVKITSLPNFAVGSTVTISNGAILSITNLVPVLVSDNAYRFVVGQTAPITGYFRFTSTYTAAQTNAVLVALPASTTALHLTDCLFSCAQTHGSFTLLESPSNGAVRTVLDRLYFRDYGGAVMNFIRPLVLDTNSALIFTSRTATDHSVTVIGYVR